MTCKPELIAQREWDCEFVYVYCHTCGFKERADQGYLPEAIEELAELLAEHDDPDELSARLLRAQERRDELQRERERAARRVLGLPEPEVSS